MRSLYRARYGLVKNLGAPAMLGLRDLARRARRGGGRPPKPHFGPPLACTTELKRIMTRHYLLARHAAGAHPVAWVTSGAPVELLRAFGFYTVYPENHGALCGAANRGTELCRVAEGHGYSQDLCSYARIDLGHLFSGSTPVGRLPKPDLLLAANNICQTVVYWYKALAHHLGIPLLLFDTPFNYEAIGEHDVAYMTAQLEEMIPTLEQVSGRPYSQRRLQEVVALAKESSELWGQALDTLKARPAPMTIFDAFAHLAPIVSLRGLPVCRTYYRTLLAELHERVERGIGALAVERKRLLWDNIAIWFKVRELSELFASRGMNCVAATYTSAWAETTHLLDTMRPLESMARTYSLVILNTNLDARLASMERFVREYRIDGLVVHSARSCKPYSVGQYDIARLLRERLGLPAVVLEADIADSRAWSEEANRDALETFFERLQDAPGDSAAGGT